MLSFEQKLNVCNTETGKMCGESSDMIWHDSKIYGKIYNNLFRTVMRKNSKLCDMLSDMRLIWCGISETFMVKFTIIYSK